MKALLTILGLILLMPVALTIVILLVASLIGGYVVLILQLFWKVALVVLVLVLIAKAVGYLVNR